MAKRPVFRAIAIPPYVETVETEFVFYPGFAPLQARKSSESLQQAYAASHPEEAGKILEVSSRSTLALGVALSAFNLKYQLSDGSVYPLECVFQASKCFANGGAYTDLLKVSPKEAKGDPRLRESGELIAFRLEGKEFPLEPKTLFYDWIYISALQQNRRLAEDVIAYSAFTDIAFNPEKSINCQAKAVAQFVGLQRSGLLMEAMRDLDCFKKTVYPDHNEIKPGRQISIFDSELM